MTDSAKKLDTQSIPKYELPNATGEELDTIGEVVGTPRWKFIPLPLTTHDSVNLFMPIEKAKKLMEDWQTKFPLQKPLSATDPDGQFEIVRDNRGFYHFKKIPQKYVIIFRKKHSI